MRILTRYILGDFVRIFVLALAGITLFMLVVGVATEAIREGLSLSPILQILPYLIPESMRYSVPAASLLAACTVFGRMAGDNELVALKAQGLSPWCVLAPVYAWSFLVSVAAVWVNDLTVTWGRPGISRVIVNSMEQIAYSVLRTHKSYSREPYSITVKTVEGDRLILPVIRIRDKNDDRKSYTITAREARLQRRIEQPALMLQLVDASIEGPNEMVGFFPGQSEHAISLDLGRLRESPSDYPLYQLPRQQKEQASEVRHLSSTLAAEAAFRLLCGDLQTVQSAAWAKNERHLAESQYRYSRLVTEPWKRWAASFSCLAFVIVGAPLSIRLRRTDVVTTFFLAFLPILLVYYPLLAFGADRAKAGALPQYAVWLGNVVLLLWGTWLLRRVFRY